MNLGAAPIFREIKILVLQRSSIYVLVMVKAVTVASGIFGQVQSLVRFLIEVVKSFLAVVTGNADTARNIFTVRQADFPKIFHQGCRNTLQPNLGAFSSQVETKFIAAHTPQDIVMPGRQF